MTIAQTFIEELEREAASTRRMLETVTDEHFDWKPHRKSMSLGQLAAHVAESYSWIVETVEKDGHDWQQDAYAPPPVNGAAGLMEYFQEKLDLAAAALESVESDEVWKKVWQLKEGDLIFFEDSKSTTMRGFFNHIYHHRGQIAVYLRLLNRSVPGMYGPSADETEVMMQTA